MPRPGNPFVRLVGSTIYWPILLVCGLSACQLAVQSQATTPIVTRSPANVRSAPPTPSRLTFTPTLSPTITTPFVALPSATSAPSPTPPGSRLCSPLAGYGLTELPAVVTNPFRPPPLGSDDPHQGVDLADRIPGSQVARPGMRVQAALPGIVAGVIADRFPYGNAVIVASPLRDIPPNWPGLLALPTSLPQALTSPVLTCPSIALPFEPTEQRSLYILYAHLQDLPLVQPGQFLACGEALGAVGQSGNALNPHLHFEVRLGPSEARFSSLAHYDNRATVEEMGLYCLWRVSGLFQLVDPLALLAMQP